ncbi:MAG: hypothetical protein WAL76_01970, partial [Candidatus Sulfotelmatobacter sp.]
HHCEGSFLPSVFGPQIKTTGFRIEPSFLSNQSVAVFDGWAPPMHAQRAFCGDIDKSRFALISRSSPLE